MQNTLFTEEIKNIFNSNYKNALLLESLKYKKELTLAEAVHVLASCDEQVLNEAMFSKMGGLVDKALETIGNKLLGAKDAIVNWVITSLGGQVQKKEQPTPFDGAKTIIPVAQMAKKDPEGFFQKVATMTGNTASGIKALYMKLEGLYEKIPLVGKIASKIPKGWRTVIIAIIVVVVAGAIIWKEKTGAGGAPKAPGAPQEAPKAPAVPQEAPKAPAPNAGGAIGALDAGKLNDLVSSTEKMQSSISRISAAVVDSKDPAMATKAIGYLEKALKVTEQQLAKPGLENIGKDKMAEILNVGGKHVSLTGISNMKDYLLSNKESILDSIEKAKAVLKGGSASDMAGAAFAGIDRAIK